MTRKHYTDLARRLYSCRPDVADEPYDHEGSGPYSGWWEAVRAVASACESDNDRFDRGRFIKACENGC